MKYEKVFKKKTKLVSIACLLKSCVAEWTIRIPDITGLVETRWGREGTEPIEYLGRSQRSNNSCCWNLNPVLLIKSHLAGSVAPSVVVHGKVILNIPGWLKKYITFYLCSYVVAQNSSQLKDFSKKVFT